LQILNYSNIFFSNLKVVRYNEEGQPWVRQQQQRFNRSRGQPQSIISDHSNIPFVGVTRIGV